MEFLPSPTGDRRKRLETASEKTITDNLNLSKKEKRKSTVTIKGKKKKKELRVN